MEKDLISVVIPVYNVEKYLTSCLDSIINQTYDYLEIILVDDGSPDNCGKICDNYAKKDNRIKVIHKINGGLSDARNAGIEIATGKYITFIDSDDDVVEDYIEYLYMMLKKDKTDISICAHSVVSDKKIIDFGVGCQNEILPKEKCFERMLCENGFTVSAWAKMYKTSLFDDVRFPIGKLCEDNGTTYKLIDKCDNISYGHLSKYNYFRRNGSIMKSNFNFKKLDLIDMTDEMCDYLEKKYPSIVYSVTKKRINARFSILRQLSECKNDEKYVDIKKNMIDYIKNNKKSIINNPLIGKRDIIAFYILKLGYIPFKISWRLYSKMRYGD